MPYVIAEAGSCHEGSFDRACELVRVAWRAGASAVKFQYCSAPAQLALQRDVPVYTYTAKPWSVHAEWLPKLSKQAHSLGLDFMCTTYLAQDVRAVAPWVDKFKISSFEANDRAFLHEHFRHLDPQAPQEIVVSLGKSETVPEWLWPGRPFILLHCVSEYPAPPCVDFRRIKREHLHGFSDHTRSVYTGAEAVKASARVLEVHYRLDDTDVAAPDYCVALTPAELTEYIRLAREARAA